MTCREPSTCSKYLKHTWSSLKVFNYCTVLVPVCDVLVRDLQTLNGDLFFFLIQKCRITQIQSLFFFSVLVLLQRGPCTIVVCTVHLLLDSAPNLGPLISRWEINKFENC